MKKYKLIVDGEVNLEHDNLSWLCSKAEVIIKVCPWAKVIVEKTKEN